MNTTESAAQVTALEQNLVTNEDRIREGEAVEKRLSAELGAALLAGDGATVLARKKARDKLRGALSDLYAVKVAAEQQLDSARYEHTVALAAEAAQHEAERKIALKALAAEMRTVGAELEASRKVNATVRQKFLDVATRVRHNLSPSAQGRFYPEQKVKEFIDGVEMTPVVDWLAANVLFELEEA